MLYIRKTEEKGRGVFSDTQIADGELIERCEVIFIPQSELADLDKTVLYNYYFRWKADEPGAAIALGYGSIYNHSYSPNARYIRNSELQTLDFVAIADIQVGEEIVVNYNGDPKSKEPLWGGDTIDWKP